MILQQNQIYQISCSVLLAFCGIGCGSRTNTPPQTASRSKSSEATAAKPAEAASPAPAPCGRAVDRLAQTEQLPATNILSPSHDQILDEAGHKTLQPLFDITQKVRRLTFKRSVDVVVQTQSNIRSYVDSKIEQDELILEKALYGSLGLLAPQDALRKVMLDVLGEQIIGYYDPAHQRLIVREDLMKGFMEKPRLLLYPDQTSAVLVHELAHALQDQQLGLHELHARDRDTDADVAFQALVEGDATLTMLAFSADLMGVSTKQMLQGLSSMRGKLAQAALANVPAPRLKAAPLILRTLLLAPYVDGVLFVAHIYQQGGWPAINRLYRRPPTSMTQILHPEKYLQRFEQKKVELPSTKQSDASLTPVHEDTLGELVFWVYFKQAADSAQANQAATGWQGDRARVYKTKSGYTALIWRSIWETEADAKEAYEAAQQVTEQTVPQHCQPLHQNILDGRSLLITRDLPISAKIE